MSVGKLGKYKIVGFCATQMQKEPHSNYFSVLSEYFSGTDWRLIAFTCDNDLFNKSLYTKGCSAVYDLINYEMLDLMMIVPETIKDTDLLNTIIEKCHQHDVPVLIWDSIIEGCSSLIFDHLGAFESIVRHVVNFHNCTDICVMAGTRNNTVSEQRIDVVRKVMRDNMLTLNENDIYYGDFWGGPTKAEMERFFNSGRKIPQAFICANDTMALEVCKILTEHGYNVPNYVIVTGFDGINFDRFCSPKLTTAANQCSHITDNMAEYLDAVKKGSKQCFRMLMPCKISFDESCGCKKTDMMKTNSYIMDYVRKHTDMENYEAYLAGMLMKINEDTTLAEAKEIIKHYALENIWICLNSDFGEYSENAIKENIKYENNMMKLHDNIQVLMQRNNEQDFSEYENFDRNIIIPHLEDVLDKTSALAIVPLHFQNLQFGYIVKEPSDSRIDFQLLHHFEARLEELLEAMRKQQKLNAVNSQLEKLYLLDPMINIFNRRGYFQEINKLHISNDKKYFVNISIDMDGLKHINDNFGHNEGDNAITVIGNSLTTVSENKNAVCARFGGDEFNVAFFTDAEPLKEGEKLLKDLFDLIEKYNKASGKKYQIGFSSGIAFTYCDEKYDLEKVLEKSDQRMYNTKNTHKLFNKFRKE